MYTTSECEDWRIRGYSKCPAYQKRLTAWLRSDAFKQQEAHTAALRQKVRSAAWAASHVLNKATMSDNNTC